MVKASLTYLMAVLRHIAFKKFKFAKDHFEAYPPGSWLDWRRQLKNPPQCRLPAEDWAGLNMDFRKVLIDVSINLHQLVLTDLNDMVLVQKA